MKPDYSIKDFTRGGQITLHNFRMYMQIINKVFLIIISIFVATLVVNYFIFTSEYQRYVFSEYVYSLIAYIFNENATDIFIQPSGLKSLVKYSDILHSTLVKIVVQDFYDRLSIAVMVSFALSIVGYFAISRWLKVRGKKHTDDVQIKGDSLVTKKELSTMLVNEKSDSDLKLAGLPLVKNKETAHFFFHGTVGTGKSNAIKELLDQIRLRGDRAIIYDKSCNYLEEYYKPQHDILLNPLDSRGESWDLWRECRDSADFDNLAAAQIPMPPSNQDPFWVNAARTIFSATAFEMRNDPNRSVMKLLRYLLTADLGLIQKYLKGTEAETLMSDKIEKTAVSIKSVMATYLKSLKYVRDDGTPFSIREWVNNENASNWLFITSLGDRHETLKPLISSWLDLVVNSLLSLTPSQSRRIWIILDELTSLQQLPYLTQTLSESRKFGGCIVIGIQNHAQLCKLYGNDGAREISALLNTRFMFRQPDPDMAKWAATNFGERITEEVNEGISYGANTMRDGISINRAETQKQLINFSEIMSLADLHVYVRLPGKWPLTSLQFQYTSRPKMNEAFILREMDESFMRGEEIEDNKSTRVDTDVDDEKSFPKLIKKPKQLLSSKKTLKTKLISKNEKNEHALDI